MIGPTKERLARPAGENKLTLMLYGSVSDPTMLRQGFYEAEIEGLKSDPRVAEVIATNRLRDVWEKRYDGLVCYFYSYTAIAALIARVRRIPVIATGGGEQVFKAMAPNLFVYLVRLTFFYLSALFVRRLLATSSTDYIRMQKLLRFNKKKVKLSFHGVNAAELASPENFELVRPHHSMITICGMDTEANIRRKGLFKAIDFLALMSEHYSDTTLTILGRTTCKELVYDYANTKGISDRLIFAGYVSEDEKFRLLRQNRFYLQFSEYEGFGIGALEAIVLGCQVVHTNVGGLRDTIAGYGIIVDGNRLDGLDVRKLPGYYPPDWPAFAGHISQFDVKKRAVTLLQELGASEERTNCGSIKNMWRGV